MSSCGGSAGGGFGVTAAVSGCSSNVPQPGNPGPGCTAINESNAKNTAGSAGFLGIGASASTSSIDAKNSVTCNPTFNNTQIINNKTANSTTIDNGVTLMTRNSINSISENTNQMVVNSITNTTSNTSQTVDITQEMEIKVTGCAGNLEISGISQNASVDLTQIATMTMTAIDSIRTDLASSVLDQFSASSSAKNNQVMNADMTTALASQQNASLQQTATSKINQTKVDAGIPTASPTQIVSSNKDANVNLMQTTSNDITNATVLSAPYSSSVDYEKTLKSVINNAVTQNFTKDTVNILSQTVIGKQKMSINVADVGGDCVIKNISQNFNIMLRQSLSAQLNIGTAITNSVASAMGTKTDDTVANDNVQSSTATTKNDLRSGQTSSQVAVSSEDYTQTVANLGGFGSSGSSGSSCICCIICIICILSCGSGALNMPTGEGGDSESSDGGDSSSSEKSAKGGFSFFN